MPVSQDKFVNQAYIEVVESGANTLTFKQLLTGISIYEKVGWIIHRIDYFFPVNDTQFAAKDDYVEFGLSVSDQIVAIGSQFSACIDHNELRRTDLGTAASGLFLKQPITKDFSNLPGGGMLIPPNPIFVYVGGNSLVGAVTLRGRMFYTVKTLKLEDYWELVEIRRMIGA